MGGAGGPLGRTDVGGGGGPLGLTDVGGGGGPLGRALGVDALGGNGGGLLMGPRVEVGAGGSFTEESRVSALSAAADLVLGTEAGLPAAGGSSFASG